MHRDAVRMVGADFETGGVAVTEEPDHVYLLVESPPKVAVSHLVNSRKGVSSQRQRLSRPDLARRNWRWPMVG